MIDMLWGFVVQWLQKRKYKQAEKFTKDTAAGFWELYHLALTCHGRHQLSNIIQAAHNDELEIDPKILGMYQLVLTIAPYQMYATIN